MPKTFSKIAAWKNVDLSNLNNKVHKDFRKLIIYVKSPLLQYSCGKQRNNLARGCSQIMSAAKGGVSKMLTMAEKGGRGGKANADHG